ncbi:GntR family transcriptional regulator [Streptodolium elevatio]|uniref:GntR family transcriptional regulator n=1 Tax=Streptodolium elevatio TaxID=3157996 RepID=A0ABV3DW05_9ACTN
MSPRATADRPSMGDAHRSLRDQAYVELRERIIEGQYAAGHRLVEREIAEELGVSRIPVREAMQRLETEGFISIQPRKGAVVADFGPEDARHFFAVRESLEALAAGLAAEHGTDAELRALERILDRSRRAAEAGRLREAVALNADFHQQIVDMSGNPLLKDLMTPLDGRLRRLFRLTSTPEDGAAMCGEHEKLYAAIAARDAAKASELARTHVLGTHANTLTMLQSSAPEATT